MQDLRYAIRLLLKSPGFTAVAVMSLAIGIGANSAIFTLVRAVFLKPLPVEDLSRLVAVYTADSKNPGQFPSSYPNFLDYRDKNTVFSGMFASSGAAFSLSSGTGEAEQVFGEVVSGSYFDVLGVRPTMGRAFLAEEDQVPGQHPVVVLTYQLWTRRFGADRTIVGKTITLNGHPFTVVGVAPNGFRGTSVFGFTALWVPAAMHAAVYPPGSFMDANFNERRAILFGITARLKPDVGLGAARAQMEALAADLARQYPIALQNRTVRVAPLGESTVPLRGRLAQISTLLLAAVVLVLLIACANVANLLLARAAARRKEIAVRSALGAGRARLIRQLLMESAVLAGVSGVVAFAVSAGVKQLLWAMRPPFMQQWGLDMSVDLTVIMFTAGLALLTSVLFGLAPALQTSRVDLTTELKERTNQVVRRGRFGFSDALVVAQITLSFVAVVAAGLFVASLRNAQRLDPGFDASRLLVLTVAPGFQGYKPPQAMEFYRQVRERVASAPGVGTVSWAEYPVLGGAVMKSVFPEGAELTPGNRGILVQYQSVGTKYFEAVGIPLLRGRDFRDADREGSVPVAIINETMAGRFWPNQEAIGKRFKIYGDQQYREVIGVARTVKYNAIGEDPRSFIYLPLAQNYAASMTLHVRTVGDPGKLLGTVRATVQSFDPNLPLTNIWTVPDWIARSLWAPKMGAALFGLFGLLALALASVGLYGVMTYTVTQRTSEIGVRMAHGAEPRNIMQMVLGQAAKRVALGISVSVLAAFGLARVAESMLFGVTAKDPATFAIAGLVLGVVAMLAALVPARRAMGVDPLVALRTE